MNIVERIERKAQEMRDGECWLTDYTPNQAFGQVYVSAETKGDQNQLLHRLAWEMHYAEPIPKGMVILHTCDNPACFNPEHLLLGTIGDNNKDRDNKGRTVNRYHEATEVLGLVNDGWTVTDACAFVGIPYSTYYQHI